MRVLKTIFTAIGIITVILSILWLLAGANSDDSTTEASQSSTTKATVSSASEPPPVYAPVPPPPPLDPATTPNIYHSVDGAAIACNDPKVTAEMQEAADHSGTLSDSAFSALWQKGECGPFSPEVLFTVTRLFEFQVAAGVVQMAEGTMKLADGSDNNFYILQNRITMVSKPTTGGMNENPPAVPQAAGGTVPPSGSQPDH